MGIDGQPGNTVVSFGEKKVKYPADVGATCNAWDKELHPECTDDAKTPPAWCAKRWCYVDPCHCDRDIWEAASYLPGATYQGKPLYFSYASCGEKKLDQTGITKSSDIDKMCAGSSPLKPLAALFVIVFASVF